MLEFLETGPVWLFTIVAVSGPLVVVYVLPPVLRWIWRLGPQRQEED